MLQVTFKNITDDALNTCRQALTQAICNAVTDAAANILKTPNEDVSFSNGVKVSPTLRTITQGGLQVTEVAVLSALTSEVHKLLGQSAAGPAEASAAPSFGVQVTLPVND